MQRTEWAAPLVLGSLLVVFGFWPKLLLDFIDVASQGYLSRLPIAALAQAVMP